MSRLRRWPILLILFVTTLSLSAVGYYVVLPRSQWISPVEWAVRTMQMISLLSHPAPDDTWPLPWARLSGAAVALYAFVKIWSRIFRIEIDRFWLERMNGHVAICGMGRKGLRLAEEFRKRRAKVVLADVDPGKDDLEYCRKLRILTVSGDATRPGVLSQLQLGRARYIFAVCREDHSNIEIGLEAMACYAEKQRTQRLDCFVHLVNLPLRVLLQRRRLLRERSGNFTLRFFNVFENIARATLAEHPLNRTPAREKRPHLVVVGLTQLGEAFVTQAAQIGHFLDLRPLRVTIVDGQASERSSEFLARQPGVAQACDLEIVQMLTSEERFARLEFLGAGEEQVTVIFCNERDEENVSLALMLADHAAGDVKLLARVAERRGLAQLLEPALEALDGGRISIFGTIEEVCRWEFLSDERIDILAKAFHEMYGVRHEIAGWEELPEDMRQINRGAADHIAVKLREIGCRLVEQGGSTETAFEFTPDEVEQLARVEHRRWSASQLLAGWKSGPERDDRKKVHPSLIPWEALSEAEKEKDREQVRDLPVVLKTVNLVIARGNNAGHRAGVRARCSGGPA